MIIEAPHLFEMVLHSLKNLEDKTYHESIVSALNGRFATQRAHFLKEFLWYYNPTKVEFLSKGNVVIFEWLKSIGVKFT